MNNDKTKTKKTFSVSLGKEIYLIALMERMGWQEESRIPTGGYMSEERLMITFQGLAEDYTVNDYIKVPSLPQGDKEYFHFYSVLVPNGYYTNSVENFKKEHDRMSVGFELCQF